MINSTGNEPSKLQQRYFALAGKYIQHPAELKAHWKEIEENYSATGRYYHTLRHLEFIFDVLEGARKFLKEPENVEWAVYYHDLIYDARRSDNEERSADSAFALLMSYGVSKKRCVAVNRLILATKTHQNPDSDSDTDYFLDADLAILGSDTERYKNYAESVRKEFAHVPEHIFNAGRSSILERFLKTGIFRTDYFSGKFEQQAKKNLEWELTGLKSPVRK